MATRPPVNPSDVEETVDKITSQFYSDSQKEASHPMDRYLHFSNHHQKTNHVMIGVAMFFLLIFGVWGFLWYQSVRDISFEAPSIDTSLISDSTDDFSALFDELASLNDAQVQQTQEATLKSDLSTALAKQIQASAVLGTSTSIAASSTER